MREVEKKKQERHRVPYPCLSIVSDRHKASILSKAYERMGEPDAVRCFVDGETKEIGILPTHPDHQNSYPVHGKEGTAQFSIGWVRSEFDLEELPDGRVKLRLDDDAGLWVADLSELLDPGEVSDP